jgi:hypothetical protein
VQRFLVALSLGGCVSTADVEGVYDVTVQDLFDDCAISEGPYPAFVMSISQLEDWAFVNLPAGGPYRDHFFGPVASAHGFTATVDGSSVTGALHGSYQTLGEDCGFLFRIDLAAEVEDDTLRATLTITDNTVFPTGCAPQPSCRTKQALEARRTP